MTDDVFGSLLDDFLLDARERADRAEELLLSLEGAEGEQRETILAEAKRELHTLKGNAGMMGFTELRELIHGLEDEVVAIAAAGGDVQPVLVGLDRFRCLLEEVAHGRAAEAAPSEILAARGEAEATAALADSSVQGGVRVSFEALDELVDLLAEMVIFKNRLADAIGRGRLDPDSARAWDEVEGAREALSKTLVFIQDRIMQLRMVPLKTLFGHLRRIVHDEGRREGKQVQLTVSGGETPMDKALLEVTSEALGHLVRNAVVHGIENPERRAAAGKPAGGSVRLDAATHANEVEIVVADDGAGIDREALLAKAVESGMALGDETELHDILFHPGLSTRSGADIGAGRGMGLYAALQSVQRLGGRIDVASEPGRATAFHLHLPLSVSIMPALLVAADGEEYAIPLTAVVESQRLKPGDGHLVNHSGVLSWRGAVIPLVDLGHVFATAAGLREQGMVVIIGAEGRHRGLLVDAVTGIREIVVKGLDAMVGTPRGVSGSTILGDGRVVLILDPGGLMALKPFVAGGHATAAAEAMPDASGKGVT